MHLQSRGALHFIMAEERGFEPLHLLDLAVFETAPFSHLGTLPTRLKLSILGQQIWLL